MESTSNFIFGFLFSLLPLSSIGLCFLKDLNKTRKMVLNIILIFNGLVFLFPLLYAYLASGPEENMWNENGPGAILWLYIVVAPLCIIAQLVLLILKIVFATRKG